MRARSLKGPILTTAIVLTVLWSIHLTVTAGHGWTLPDSTREQVGASAATVFSRLYAQLTAPFFHESLGHLAYNSLLFALALPFALRRLGTGRGLLVAYLSSPLAGVLVDVLLILPLAAVGVPVAVEAAPRRLVGASVVAFSGIGMVLAGLAGPRVRGGAMAGVVVYELALAASGVTQPFVFAYHLTGLGAGFAAGQWATRRSSEKNQNARDGSGRAKLLAQRRRR